MGLDLILVPIRYDRINWWLATNRLDTDRDYNLYEQIAEHGRTTPIKRLPAPRPLPEKTHFEWYEDEGLKIRKDDPYGSPLTMLTAGELAQADTSQSSAWNKAVWEMIRNLPPDTPIVLWWH